jgi:hypothetical protein
MPPNGPNAPDSGQVKRPFSNRLARQKESRPHRLRERDSSSFHRTQGLKASHKHLENAYKLNLSDYRTTIPQVFWYNGIIILSNGSKSRIGSITAG